MEEYKFSQLDVTEHFDDRDRLTVDDWIKTIPLISTLDPIQGSKMGLVSPEAPDDEVYKRALNMSLARGKVGDPKDGVYCPISHMANIDLKKLGTPCPKCGRPLLRFGWD